MKSQAQVRQLGYILTEEQHEQVTRGIDSLRFLEGLAAAACNAPSAAASLDLEDLTGYLQLLLSQTRAPMKALTWGCWTPIDSANEAHVEAITPTEAELLKDFRTMQAADRKHLQRCASALALAANSETRT